MTMTIESIIDEINTQTKEIQSIFCASYRELSKPVLLTLSSQLLQIKNGNSSWEENKKEILDALLVAKNQLSKFFDDEKYKVPTSLLLGMQFLIGFGQLFTLPYLRDRLLMSNAIKSLDELYKNLQNLSEEVLDPDDIEHPTIEHPSINS